MVLLFSEMMLIQGRVRERESRGCVGEVGGMVELPGPEVAGLVVRDGALPEHAAQSSGPCNAYTVGMTFQRLGHQIQGSKCSTGACLANDSTVDKGPVGPLCNRWHE